MAWAGKVVALVEEEVVDEVVDIIETRRQSRTTELYSAVATRHAYKKHNSVSQGDNGYLDRRYSHF